MTKQKKQTIVTVIALILICLGRFFPRPAAMPASAMQVLCIFIGVLILWLTVGVHWPSALCLAAVAFIPELSFGTILSSTMGSSITTFLIFTFMCSYTLSKTPFMRRVALWFITRKLARKGPWWFLMLYFGSMVLLACIMSPSVLFVTYIAITEEIFEMLHLKKGDHLASMIMVGQTMSCCLGSAMTPIAHDGPILGIGLYEAATGSTVGYAQYLAIGIPLGILVFIVMMLVFRFLIKPDLTPIRSLDLSAFENAMPGVDKREGVTLAVFLGVIALWVLPNLTTNILPTFSSVVSSYGIAMPPLLGTIILCIVHDKDGAPMMDYNDALKNGVSWICVIMTGAVLALSSALSNADIGFTDYIGTLVEPVLGSVPSVVCVLILVLTVCVMTNICSNLVSITLVLTIGFPICLASNGSISAAILTVLVSFGGAFAVATPSAQPLVAIGVGNGYVNTGMLAKYGYLVAIIAAILGATVAYQIGVMVMPGMI